MKLEALENSTSISSQALEKFLDTELDRMKSGCLPLKPDSLHDRDLDEIVLFEELQPLLFDVECAEGKKKLLLGVLSLLGRNPIVR